MPLPILVAPVAVKAGYALLGWVGINTGLAVAGATKDAIQNHKKEVKTDPTKLSFKERLTGKVQTVDTQVITEQDLAAEPTRAGR